MVVPATALAAPSRLGASNSPALFLIEAKVSLLLVASEKST